VAYEIRSVPADQPPASDLLEAMVVEVGELYGTGRIDNPEAPSASPAELTPPRGDFVVVYDTSGRAVAGGAVKGLGDGVGEIKRMYVVPEARGRGVARVLLRALEDAARRLGFTRARLDTGRLQPQAQALYESAGYRAIPDYNGNPYASWWAEKEL
jgi:GNAT superfamily N-acetyltransferase